MDTESLKKETMQEAKEIIRSPEAAFEAVKKLTGLVIGLSIASTSFTFAMRFVLEGDTPMIFGSLALFWGGYLFAHYAATGKVIHQKGKGKKLPGDRLKAVLAVGGIVLILAGLTFFPVPVIRGEIARASLALLVSASGYVLAHYGFTGSLL